jgi:multimeric flavodoxin WrbA
VCITDDDNRRIAAAYIRSDLVVLLSPVTFGGYSSDLKRGLDHLLQNLSPQFLTVDGQTHHRRRYRSYPDLMAVGWAPSPDPTRDAVFGQVVTRNARNMHAATVVHDVTAEDLDDRQLDAAVEAWLDRITTGRSTPAPALTVPGPFVGTRPRPERAVLLVGSPRTRHSTSYSLGNFLLERLDRTGVDTRTVFVHTQLGSSLRRDRVLPVLDTTDLLILAHPLHIDTLPAPVIAALEHVANRWDRSDSGPRAHARLVAITNCGFPEAAHNAAAIAASARFAHETGLVWAGGLSLGGGEGLIHGRPLDDLGRRGRRFRTAMDLAARDLADGRGVSRTAIDMLALPMIPTEIYRALGNLGWRRQARRNGASGHLDDRPYTPTGISGISVG